MEHLIQQLLSLILIYGYPIIILSILVSSVGVPLPQSVIILAAGSLAGVGDFNISALFLVITFFSILGDLIDYYLGKCFGYALFRWIKKRSKLFNIASKSLEENFNRWSGITIFLSRWLFTPVSSVVSVLAGVYTYPLSKFVLLAVFGDIISSAIYLSIGYVLGINWIYIWEYFNSIPGILTGLVLGIVFIRFGVSRFKRSS